MKNSKKFLSSILAVAMLASMSVSSFAVDETPGDLTVDNTANTDVLSESGSAVTVNGKVKAPIMKVLLPATAAKDGLLLNPYKVQVDGKEAPQVLSAAIPIDNYSSVPVDVFVKNVTATSDTANGGELVISAKAPTAKDTDKNVYLVLRTAATAGDIKTLEEGKLVAGSETKAGDIVIGTADLKNKILVAQGLAAGDGTNTKGGSCVSKIVGQMASNPTKIYTDKDKITVSTVYMVRPSTAPTK